MTEKQDRKFKHVAFVLKLPLHAGRTLINSIMEEIQLRGIELDEYNLCNSKNLYDTSVLDTLFANRNKYDAVFVLDLGYLYDYRIHKSLYKCPVVLITGDDPQNFLPKQGVIARAKRYIKSKVGSIVEQNELIGNAICAKQYDIVLTPQKMCVEMYQSRGIANVFWLPYWVDSKLFKKASVAPTLDVTTVMMVRIAKRINALQFLANQKTFTFENRNSKYGPEVVEQYHKGSMIFNLSNHNEFTIRVVEAMASGRLLLTDQLPKESGLYDLFTEGKHFVSFTDLPDLKQKIEYYKEHTQERERIAEAGFTEVMANHTEKQRVDFIFDILHDFNKPSQNHTVSFHIISWNRPWLLKFTLDSLKNSLKDSPIDYEIIVFDQGSQYETRTILRDNFEHIDKVINFPTNAGMARAWVNMYAISSGEYIIPVENDWWCNTSSAKWLTHALEILQTNDNVAFVKLRTIADRQYGTGSLTHEPWTVKPFPKDIVDIKQLSDGTKYYIADSKYNCFTFNPLLIRKTFRDEFDQYYQDNAINYDPLRSGEDLPSDKWREQTKWRGASLTDGPFKHIGFPELKEHVRYMPFFILKHWLNLLVNRFNNK